MDKPPSWYDCRIILHYRHEKFKFRWNILAEADTIVVKPNLWRGELAISGQWSGNSVIGKFLKLTHPTQPRPKNYILLTLLRSVFIYIHILRRRRRRRRLLVPVTQMKLTLFFSVPIKDFLYVQAMPDQANEWLNRI